MASRATLFSLCSLHSFLACIQTPKHGVPAHGSNLSPSVLKTPLYVLVFICIEMQV
jgi:hypothetical protein